MATTTAAYIPSDEMAKSLVRLRIEQELTAMFTRRGVRVEIGQTEDDGTVRVSLVADGDSFDFRAALDYPTLTGQAWLVDGSHMQVDYEFESNPVSFLTQHEVTA